MGKDDRIEQMLVEWAQWLKVGDGSGYSTISVLHVDWMPPSPGITPTLKTSHPSRVRRLHRLIGLLSRREADTLVVHYCMRLAVEDQAVRLECAVSTVHARIESIHKRLRAWLVDDPEKKEFHAL